MWLTLNYLMHMYSTIQPIIKRTEISLDYFNYWAKIHEL